MFSGQMPCTSLTTAITRARCTYILRCQMHQQKSNDCEYFEQKSNNCFLKDLTLQ